MANMDIGSKVSTRICKFAGLHNHSPLSSMGRYENEWEENIREKRK